MFKHKNHFTLLVYFAINDSHFINENKNYGPSASRKTQISSPLSFSAHAHLSSFDQYEAMYQKSIQQPNNFWLEQADSLAWFKTKRGLQVSLGI